MARAVLKLKRPITEFEVDLEENTLESLEYIKVVHCVDCRDFEQNGEKHFGNCSRHCCLCYFDDYCSWADRKEE